MCPKLREFWYGAFGLEVANKEASSVVPEGEHFTAPSHASA
jgi:hypothetical protein